MYDLISVIASLTGFLVVHITQGLISLFVLIVFLVFLIVLFGKEILWRYRADGYCEACLDEKLKFEISKRKREEAIFRLEAQFKPEYLDQGILLLLNEYALARIKPSDNNKLASRIEFPVSRSEPEAGDKLIIKIGSNKVFEEPLYKD